MHARGVRAEVTRRGLADDADHCADRDAWTCDSCRDGFDIERIAGIENNGCGGLYQDSTGTRHNGPVKDDLKSRHRDTVSNQSNGDGLVTTNV